MERSYSRRWQLILTARENLFTPCVKLRIAVKYSWPPLASSCLASRQNHNICILSSSLIGDRFSDRSRLRQDSQNAQSVLAGRFEEGLVRLMNQLLVAVVMMMEGLWVGGEGFQSDGRRCLKTTCLVRELFQVRHFETGASSK